MAKKVFVECNQCSNTFKVKKYKKYQICPVCHEETKFEKLERLPLLRKSKKPSDYYVMCCSCHKYGHVLGRLPQRCPNPGCRAKWLDEPRTVLDGIAKNVNSILLDMLRGGSTVVPKRGYWICDRLGFVEGKEGPWPTDRIDSENMFNVNATGVEPRGNEMRPVRVSTGYSRRRFFK